MSDTTQTAAGVSVTRLPVATRYSLRLREASIAAAEAALGLTLPQRIGQADGAGGRRALMLGPDEWLIETTEGHRPSMPADIVHALVDISDREVVWRLEGPRVIDLLSIGIARDVRHIAPGTGCRTAFDTAQVILVRESETAFTMAAWRSFAPHVEDLLAIGQRELASGL